MKDEKYPLFKKELKVHGKNGYHVVEKNINSIDSTTFESLNKEFLTFISEIGFGSFYNRSIELFDFRDELFVQFNREMKKLSLEDFIAIGSNATTEGCFCLKKDKEDTSVYWLNWNAETPFVIHTSFYAWIESTPCDLFDVDEYKAFKKVKDINAIHEVINERKKVNIQLVSYNRKLEAIPNESEQYLKRYNEVIFEVIKEEKINLKLLTIKMFRNGSKVNNDNISYVTINIENVEVQVATRVKAYLFDPFNIPFENIIAQYNPEIDLTIPTRVVFKEIVAFL